MHGFMYLFYFLLRLPVVRCLIYWNHEVKSIFCSLTNKILDTCSVEWLNISLKDWEKLFYIQENIAYWFQCSFIYNGIEKSYSDTCSLIHFLCKTFSKFKIIKVSKVSKKLLSDIFQKMGKKKICHKMYKLHPTKLLSLVFDKVLTSPRGVQRQMSTINQFCEENENKFP